MSTIKDVQKICLKLLDKFIDVCDKYNLKWFADSGTLLGAIRKNEFILWDDDIDVIMPRNDYNKLLEIAEKEFTTPYFFQSPLSDNYWDITCKLRYDNTTFLTNNKYNNNEYNTLYHKGVFIDIFVYDNIPNDVDIFESMQLFLRFIYCFSSVKKYGTTSFENKYDAKEVFKFINDSLTKLSNMNGNSDYVANLFFNYQRKYRNFIISKEAYSSYFTVDFKGLKHQLRIPQGFNEILKLWYGDDWYIEKKITSSHGEGVAFYDTSKSYKEYEKLDYNKYKLLFGGQNEN